MGLNSVDSWQGAMLGFCKDDDEPSWSRKAGNFVDQISKMFQCDCIMDLFTRFQVVEFHTAFS
jgi:hypothetical protein